jgi:hypothetical protein
MKRLIAALAAGIVLAAGASGCTTTVPGRGVPAPHHDHPVQPGLFVHVEEVEPCVTV